MRDNDILDSDVDLTELASLTKNFSGAEIAGMIKSATSFSFNRHVKVGSLATVTQDYENMKVMLCFNRSRSTGKIFSGPWRKSEPHLACLKPN